MGDEESCSMCVHAAETAHNNEASLRSAAITSVNGGSVLDSSMLLVSDKLGCQESTAHPS